MQRRYRAFPERTADQRWTFLFVLGEPRFERARQAIIEPIANR